MYNKIKLILRKILPNQILFQLEPKFRALHYQFYKGKQFHCNVCDKNLRKFLKLNNETRLCPNCGSISRDRRLWKLLNTEFLREKIRILDFSPSRCIYRKLKKHSSVTYISTDISGDFLSDKRLDITNIEINDNSYDLIICYHILEHIKNDSLAMDELFRILTNKGICIIQTPFIKGNIYEDFSITTNQDRLNHFGQEDHVRIYSVGGLKERLIKSGFQVEVKNFDEININTFGFLQQETILVCTKNNNSTCKKLSN